MQAQTACLPHSSVLERIHRRIRP